MVLKLSHKNSRDDLSDTGIILEYRKKKKPDLLAPLFERYMHLVFGICMKYLKNIEEAEDASMDILENLFDKLLKHEIDNFPAWLHSLSKNHCLMILRSKKKFISVLNEEEGIKLLENFVESDSDLHLYNKHEADLSLMEEVLTKLDDEQASCISLFYLAGNSYQEVAKKTGFSIKQVKSHIQNGKRNLKNQLLLIQNGKTE